MKIQKHVKIRDQEPDGPFTAETDIQKVRNGGGRRSSPSAGGGAHHLREVELTVCRRRGSPSAGGGAHRLWEESVAAASARLRLLLDNLPELLCVAAHRKSMQDHHIFILRVAHLRIVFTHHPDRSFTR